MGQAEILCLISLIIGILNLIALVILLVRGQFLKKRDDKGEDDRVKTEEIITGVTASVLEKGNVILEREMTSLRTEMNTVIRADRVELTNAVNAGFDRNQKLIAGAINEFGTRLARENAERGGMQDRLIKSELDATRKQIAVLTETLDTRYTELQKAVIELVTQKFDALGTRLDTRLDGSEKQIALLAARTSEIGEQTRQTVETRLASMEKGNAEALERMRATVDEKLQETLNTRITQSFNAVNERLAEVYRGLGEMQTLAGNVGDLKKVLTGVKTRGIFGEIQLGSIIEDLMSPEQYEKNVATKPDAKTRVEYAIRLPGDGNGSIYLPIDAKFPGDCYAHLQDAYADGDAEKIKAAQKELSDRIKAEARDIKNKYISPPHTTNFGILFLPFEGLYAEAVRLGLTEEVRKSDYVTVVGPTTLAALINSLQMGFRTLAVQKRSEEVWRILASVKTEFSKFEKVLEVAQLRITQTQTELDQLVGTRTRQINQKLSSVTQLPEPGAVSPDDTVISQDF